MRLFDDVKELVSNERDDEAEEGINVFLMIIGMLTSFQSPQTKKGKSVREQMKVKEDGKGKEKERE